MFPLLPPQPPPPSKAFSLIELLVVLAILAVLIGVLLPTLASARRAAVETRCRANLRSVHQLTQLFATDHEGRVPLGYRGGRMQWNTMVYSGTSGKFVLFGRLFLAGLMDRPEVFYCPAETAPSQAFNTPDNPWPPGPTGDPAANVQGGYASAPIIDWGFADSPPQWPLLDAIAASPLFADTTGLPERLDTRHVRGVHTLFGDASVTLVPREVFNTPLSQCVGLSPANNPHQANLWQLLATAHGK